MTSQEKIMNLLNSTVMALMYAVASKDPYTAKHQRRVAFIACAIAQAMGEGADFIEGIRVMGLLHDLGKIAIPSQILSKPGKLSQQEFDLVKTHPGVGYEILVKIDFPWPVALAVLQHHERLDGSGYPRGLSGSKILLEAKILAVADVVEAITSHRPYRPAMGIKKALAEISEKQWGLYDPDVVRACLKVFALLPKNQDDQYLNDQCLKYGAN